MKNISRRNFVQATAAAFAGLGLAACSGNGDGAAAEGGIKVGVIGPYSGNVAQYGIACRNGSLLYIKQVNEAGGVNGKQIVAVVEDEKGDATEAVTVYNKLVQDGVCGIVGDVTSTPSIAVAQASVADNMPCVTPSATAADVISYGKNTFRACITDPFQGKVMAEFAAKQGYKTVGTIYNSGGDYEVGVENAFVETAEKNGITVSSRQGYPDGAVDFNAQLTSIVATAPDAILAPNYYQDAGKIITQARQLGYTGPIIGVDGWSNIVGSDQEYASAADLKDCYYCTSFVNSNPDEAVQTFVDAYKAEYGDAPTNFCALGYDAAMVMVAGIKAAEEKGLEAGTDEYKQAVIDGIAAGTVQGVTGAISYDGTGDPVKSTLILKFVDGVEEIQDVISA